MEKFFQQGQDDTLVVAFHGTGGNEYQLLSTIAALFPDASVLSYLGTEKTGQERRFFAQLVDGKLDRVDFEKRVTEFLEEEWPTVTKKERIIFIGYSNGANFVLGLLEKQPELADTVILLHPSNFVYQFETTAASTQLLLTSGAQDSISLPGEALALSQQLEKSFSNVHFLLLDGDHQVSEDEINRLKTYLKK
ncbi:alpha/beta hydrolase [Enterococcus sp. JM9B]|uniref:alpha/beta hydrolase n=1 Tax=Enterococcus sp. JM9B TaxID=1857216 RepID=UPI001374C790|nr:phospholipase [Enterococcus sp. JM9B]KAF1302333.1 phospholipase [Enterococcus sp. JM9B]